MGIIDFLKRKKKEDSLVESRNIEIPPAPPTKDELPTFPTAEEIPTIKEEAVRKKIVSPLDKAEKYVIDTQQAELDERDDLSLKKPIFIYLDAYKEIMNEASLVNTTMKEATASLNRVSEFKEDEDKEYKKWEAQIKDIQKKLTYADKILFASQR